MDYLTLQAFVDNCWVDVAKISFPGSDHGSYTITELDYESDYALNFMGRDDIHAASLNHPVSLYFEEEGRAGWMRFLDDIMPSGASRRYWAGILDLDGLTPDQQDFVLLKHGTLSPVGNLRIKESLPEYFPQVEAMTFTVDDVINRAGDFLDYAQLRGAVAGGATGAGGEAPKLLLRCSDDQRIWIDTFQNDPTNRDMSYLVKFPRGQRSAVDCNILRAEFHYYHELKDMGFDTIETENMRLEEGTHYPSLWLPRFDIYFGEEGEIKRYGLESVCSILKKPPGTGLDQEETIRRLIEIINQTNRVREQGFRFDVAGFVIEWVRRDLLNIIFGNSDNHGRNTSFLKDENVIELAPIYDFAPMKADPEGIARMIKWKSPLERGGEYDFNAIATALSDLVAVEELMQALRLTAKQLTGLKERLVKRGVPEQIIEMPGIGLDYIPQKLTRWGLL